MNLRVQDNDKTIYDFGYEFLVVCPRCSLRAVVVDRGSHTTPRIMLTCEHCGQVKHWEATTGGILTARNPDVYQTGQVALGAPVDWYFHLPLWLQLPCCDETLWAYNKEHLQFIEAYVRAELRERTPTDNGWSNNSLQSRLPTWIKRAKNRRTVLKCIAELKKRLES